MWSIASDCGAGLGWAQWLAHRLVGLLDSSYLPQSPFNSYALRLTCRSPLGAQASKEGKRSIVQAMPIVGGNLETVPSWVCRRSLSVLPLNSPPAPSFLSRQWLTSCSRQRNCTAVPRVGQSPYARFPLFLLCQWIVLIHFVSLLSHEVKCNHNQSTHCHTRLKQHYIYLYLLLKHNLPPDLESFIVM